LELRGGNQVISWGESTFIQNGINVINPVDISAARKPGSEVKEFFTPILAAKAALGLPNNFSLEGFYQFKADNIVPDPSGTFFSSADIIGRGSQPIRAGVNDRGDDSRFNPFQVANGLDDDIFWQSRLGVNVPSVSIERANDKNADDGGEFGFALRYFAEELNNGTEFGLYFINYHSRLPILTTSMSRPAATYSVATATHFTASARLDNALAGTNGVPLTAATDVATVAANAGVGTAAGGAPANAYEMSQMFCNTVAPIGAALAATGASVNFANPGGYTNCNTILRMRRGAADMERNIGALLGNSSNYRLEYPEDIKLLGISASTTLGSLAFQAEATYRHDQPMSYVGSEVSALSNDLSGMTALLTGAAMPVGTGPGQALPGSIGATANIAPTRFSAAVEANGVDKVPGNVVGAMALTPGLAAAADKAAAGTLTAADVTALLGPTGVDGQPLIPITPQTRASQLTAANVRPDGFVEIPTEDVFTAQTTLTSALFGSNPVVQMMQADGGAVVAEVGMVWAPGISTSSAIASSGSEGLLNPIAASTYKLNADLKGPTNYATPFSWGAQGIFNMTYNRVFGSPVNLVPQIAWRWDMGGRTPSPLGNYMAERKAIGLSLAANYQSRWTGSMSWTANFGPDAPLDDRDFASINIAYAF
ncbi:unnamed protein product, partial [Phaeothamnion confervicola]